MKRLFDLFAASLIFLLLWPLMLLLAGVIYCKIGRPVLFRQVRAGFHAKPFTMYKFRTMLDVVDTDGLPLPDDLRMTTLGRSLRASSLDELPELWNVLKGDMSLVGPRPLLMEYVPLYNSAQLRRHEVRPGITGWAQVNGRNALTWDEKFKLDLWYIENRTFRLDCKVLWLTIWKVLLGDGVSATGSATMPKFKGNKY
ncbi:sugar transferase [Thalassospira xianhensis]|uniref:Sugar transferase n=1 Tax=Thalassospira xianhensis MCCC 1A02616 TaxID=1177929 RepID=A0A367UIA1_9PROT|nr:sugar transferase [Thalassospira xianhensis]RCK07363.1 sugar transferase [Thalassospira xianhensis MCCC 1A02616]